MALGAGLGTILGSGLGVISSLFSNLFGKNENELSYRRQLDMWNKQNEYNHPAAQMARLAQAGLNPHLVYGTGNVANSVSSSSPKYTPTKFDPYTQFGSLGAMEQVVANNQTRQTDANVREADARIEKTIQEKLDIQEKRQQNYQDLLIKQQKVIEYKLKNAKTEVEKKYWEEMAYSNNELLKQQVQKTQSETDVNMARVDNLHADTSLKGAQTVTELGKPALQAAQTDYYASGATLNNASAQEKLVYSGYIANYMAPKAQSEIDLLNQKYFYNLAIEDSMIQKANQEVLKIMAETGGIITESQLKQISMIQLGFNTDEEWKLYVNYWTEILHNLGGSVPGFIVKGK